MKAQKIEYFEWENIPAYRMIMIQQHRLAASVAGMPFGSFPEALGQAVEYLYQGRQGEAAELLARLQASTSNIEASEDVSLYSLACLVKSIDGEDVEITESSISAVVDILKREPFSQKKK